MPARYAGIAYGPGFATSGTPLEFDVTDYGLSLVTAEAYDGTPPWTEVKLKRQGFNGSQLLIEWPGRNGRYAISVAEPGAIAAITAAGAKQAPVQAVRADVATRAWSHGLIWICLVLPLLLLGLAIWQHERIAEWAVARVPVAEERRLGELVFSQNKARLKLVEGPAAAMVREIGAKLTPGSPYAYEFYVTDDRTVNAYAMPGGFVVVHTGLLALAATPEEVAGVLAHEVRHVEGRHSLRAMLKSAGLMATMTLVFGDTGGLVGIADQLIGLKFSRDQEAEADRDGLTSLVKAGVNAQGMRDFFKKMAAQEKLNPGWLSTHPASDERFARMDAAIARLPEAARKAPALAYDYAAIKATLLAAAPQPRDTKP
jgi:predicted Zn-dependent protease